MFRIAGRAPTLAWPVTMTKHRWACFRPNMPFRVIRARRSGTGSCSARPVMGPAASIHRECAAGRSALRLLISVLTKKHRLLPKTECVSRVTTRMSGLVGTLARITLTKSPAQTVIPVTRRLTPFYKRPLKPKCVLTVINYSAAKR